MPEGPAAAVAPADVEMPTGMKRPSEGQESAAKVAGQRDSNRPPPGGGGDGNPTAQQAGGKVDKKTASTPIR
eukprot:1373388-Pyramimonas_sp.AAC.1